MRRRELAGWVVAGGLLLVAAGKPDAGRFRRLVVEDERGRDRIILEVSEGVPRIRVLRPDGKLGWSAGVMTSGYGFTLAVDPTKEGVQLP